MAARRLVIVMVVLLGLATLAAALVQPPEQRGAATDQRRKPEGTTGSGSSADAPPGRVVGGKLRISNAGPREVRVRPGDQLRLAVAGSVGEDIVIPAFGLTETMSPYAPAQFDILVDRPGRFVVRGVDSGRLAGRIVSAPPDADDD